ncbi:hypothetical protein VN12_19625 [Pirellula sp. SH-Sr6A]|nr:hypothetical protein VN12_19625 [Pirellula sp. SH-Sr6A]
MVPSGVRKAGQGVLGMSAHTTWTSVHPPKLVFLVQWDHIEGEYNGKPDIRRMQVWCDEKSLDVEVKHLERRKVKYTVTKYLAEREENVRP